MCARVRLSPIKLQHVCFYSTEQSSRARVQNIYELYGTTEDDITSFEESRPSQHLFRSLMCFTCVVFVLIVSLTLIIVTTRIKLNEVSHKITQLLRLNM